MTFPVVLVANRGEIARRIIRTLRQQGIRSVAVYSDADASAPHVREADDAVRLGPAPASESYLDIDAVIAAARTVGAAAIHPGYGFLSESVGLAEACAETGIVFVGPSIEALKIMGDKARAREHVMRSGVPVVPGFDAKGLSDLEIAEEAESIGFPLLVKPSAGGGGKGMEIVGDAAALAGALASARRVAASAFGDDSLILERLIRRPRHIEVQIFGDTQGSVIALGERECTLQRRHQKVLEEAPSAGIPTTTRERLLAAAIQAGESVSYVGAGTVEFLVDADAPEEIFFIEMNTRLQVEHPVTEEVTGLDLVALQLSVAAGLPLEAAPPIRGHAVEARVYAESPERGFLPSTGTVLLFEPPIGVRVDAAVESGSEVTGFYDPMIAKVIAVADDRRTALERLDDALSRTVVLGVETNIAFLRRLCRDARVASGDLDTGLIDTLLPYHADPPSSAMLAAVRSEARTTAEPIRTSALWRELPGWRLGGDAVAPHGARAVLTEEGDILESSDAAADGPAPDVRVARDADGAVWVAEAGRSMRLRPLDRRQRMRHRLAARGGGDVATDPEARAPMPGTIVAVHAIDGATVTAGTPLVAVEAMKMEHQVLAPHDGVVRLLVAVGDQVRRDQPVARVTTEES
ncbi:MULTISPECIES: biotin carboxylase N-terminal domain-containing protein [unclassified Microbacterium]|uniref:acetyl/propionyl/methylcrotonyl-CoA carboxylase subunit alpha n=1 Tax=unclassified Microbacterium TaxID=2609290 RepID=UPI000EA8F601|nr:MULTISPECIES: biotin carboxylase N-terminal domain-containing protein [unclassified Microbacterium]MBT2485865.1 acetyl/propionyl-CoA carboxylase subunit alpha [Microbacterium sp. ISL-108]RKN68622.1 acetyl/propionyl-CoA carboxylase subunit alpha [Microbacterium sp. CGR2]